MAHETVDYQDRIARDPDDLVGKPVVKGTRIPAEPAPSVAPQQFYAEITKRADVSDRMRRLAR